MKFRMLIALILLSVGLTSAQVAAPNVTASKAVIDIHADNSTIDGTGNLAFNIRISYYIIGEPEARTRETMCQTLNGDTGVVITQKITTCAVDLGAANGITVARTDVWLPQYGKGQ